jgi:hypothetical protein
MWSIKKTSDRDKIFLLNWNIKPRNFNWISSKRSQTFFRICQSNHFWNYRFSNQLRSNFLVFIVKHKLSPTQPKLIFFSAISGRNLSPVRSFVLHYSHTCLLYFYLHPLLHSQNQILFNWHNKVFYKLARFSKWHFNLKVQKGRKQLNYIILFSLDFFPYLKYDFKTKFVCGLFC